MRLPNGEAALVEDHKLLDYVLNLAHPVGRHHAALFERLLGITQENYSILKSTLLEGAKMMEASLGKHTPHGQKYEMRLPVAGPKGSKDVLAVWLIEVGSDRPRLITCYVE